MPRRARPSRTWVLRCCHWKAPHATRPAGNQPIPILASPCPATPHRAKPSLAPEFVHVHTPADAAQFGGVIVCFPSIGSSPPPHPAGSTTANPISPHAKMARMTSDLPRGAMLDCWRAVKMRLSRLWRGTSRSSRCALQCRQASACSSWPPPAPCQPRGPRALR